MKLYFFLTLALAALQICLAADKVIPCTGTKPLVTCPHGDSITCLAYCAHWKARQPAPNRVRWLCDEYYGVMCPAEDPAYCVKYCGGPVKAISQ